MRVIHLARKPLSESSVAANMLKHGAGGINIDATRVGYVSEADLTKTKTKNPGRGGELMSSLVYGASRPQQSVNTEGRWPANVVLQHIGGCHDVCEPGCPVVDLNDHGMTTNGFGAGDAGGASRFFKQCRADDE